MFGPDQLSAMQDAYGGEPELDGGDIGGDVPFPDADDVDDTEDAGRERAPDAGDDAKGGDETNEGGGWFGGALGRLFGGGGSAHGAEDNDQLYHYRQSYPYPGQDGQDASPACHSLL